MAITEKYLAGLIDSDGSIRWNHIQEGRTPGIVLSISQLQSRDKVFHLIAETFGGTVHSRQRPEVRCPNPVSEWQICGSKARMLLQRILKYVVIKYDYFNWALEISAAPLLITSIEFNKIRKEKRNTPCAYIRNFPSRKWLAGYFDGDGTVGVSHVGQDNKAIIRFGITAHKLDSMGIELIQKNFGGSFSDTSKDRSCTQWTLYLSKNNREQGINFLDYFFKNSVIKYDQLLAVKQYLDAEFPDGLKLKEKLLELKQPPAETNSSEGQEPKL